MRNPFIIQRRHIDRLFLIHGLTMRNLLVWQVRDVVRWLFFAGMIIAVFGSLLPWFLWPIAKYYQLIACVPLVVSLAMSIHLRQPIFTARDYIYPTVAVTVLISVMALCGGKNVTGFITIPLGVTIFLSLFMVDKKELQALSRILTRIMATILAISIPFYILYLIGRPLPHYHVAPEAVLHTYENYRFFLVDDRFELEIIPRFISVFPEPSWLGMGCVSLLFSQAGRWNTWACRILFVGLLMSFSLAAYICLIVMLFVVSWIKGNAIMGKFVLLTTVCAALIVGSLYYNRGDNLVNTLIVQRLTFTNDGKLEGDNRTTEVFTKEFDKMMKRGEWLTGKGQEAFVRFGEGNSGFRVFLYINGAISVICLIVFFATIVYTSHNPRARLAFLLFSGLAFVSQGVPLRYIYFIPMYILLFCDLYPKKQPIKPQSDGTH